MIMAKKKAKKTDKSYTILSVEDIIELMSMYLMSDSEYYVEMDNECSACLINTGMVNVIGVNSLGHSGMSLTDKSVVYINKILKVKLPKQVWK